MIWALVKPCTQVLALLEQAPPGQIGAVTGRGAAVAGLQLESRSAEIRSESSPAGSQRHRPNPRPPSTSPDFDLIITTYGTLRRDASYFKDVTFDYVILDEAQAIKNNTTEAAKAARLLRGKHKLALTGTPIENHVGELWSLFEYLNPGIARREQSPSFPRSLVGQEQNAEGRQLLSARLSAPSSSAAPKTKSPLICRRKLRANHLLRTGSSAARKLYDELREHYRQTLMGSIAAVGLNKSKIQILEAALVAIAGRRRAIPRLIDKKRSGEARPRNSRCMIAEQLGEVLEEGHKAARLLAIPPASCRCCELAWMRTKLHANLASRRQNARPPGKRSIAFKPIRIANCFW